MNKNALSGLQNDIDKWIDKVSYKRKQTLLKLVERQRVPFSALHAIYQTVQDLQQQDIRLLSSLTPCYLKTIIGMPAPFIYERLG